MTRAKKTIDWRTYRPPAYCRGGGDYCQYCGRDLCDSRPCEWLQQARYALISEDEIAAFGCSLEASVMEYAPECAPSMKCEKWCRKSQCPFTMKEAADELVC
jgi:hypothetical protein